MKSHKKDINEVEEGVLPPYECHDSSMTPTFAFEGRHYMASIYKTNVSNANDIRCSIGDCLQECGATIIGYTEHIFENHAITFCYLLSESHCTVHTYPEHDSMWMDVFTCGTTFDIPKFEHLLQMKLHVGSIVSNIIKRN